MNLNTDLSIDAPAISMETLSLYDRLGGRATISAAVARS